MIRLPPRSTRTDPPLPYSTLCRSDNALLLRRDIFEQRAIGGLAIEKDREHPIVGRRPIFFGQGPSPPHDEESRGLLAAHIIEPALHRGSFDRRNARPDPRGRGSIAADRRISPQPPRHTRPRPPQSTPHLLSPNL